MTLRALVLPVLLALTVTGCSSTVDGRATTDSASGSAPTIGEADLEGVLLTVDDLPEGYESQPPDDDSDDGRTTFEPAACADLLGDEDDDDEPLAQAEAGFFDPEAVQTVLLQVALVDGSAVPQVQEVAALAEQCPEFVATDADGQDTTYTLDPLDPGELGDAAAGLRLTTVQAATPESAELTLTLDLVVVAVGPIGVFFLAGGLDAPDAEEVTALLETTVARAERAGA